jgi:hypothetical protein
MAFFKCGDFVHLDSLVLFYKPFSGGVKADRLQKWCVLRTAGGLKAD